jgi:formylglycine-generating enzyme required for sulfatase activity
MRFVLIPGGQEFEMGARDEEALAKDYEKPPHRVRISRPFLLSRFEVTQGEFATIMGFNPSYFSAKSYGSSAVRGKDTSRFPVENVTWYDALAFCNKLSQREGRGPCYELSDIKRDHNSIVEAAVKVLGGGGYRLPTEAEWECAARAGTTTIFAHGNSISSEEANIDGTGPYGNAKKGVFLKGTAAIGSYPPNPWGLYDTAGNIDEWVWDGFDEKCYGLSAGKVAVDPSGPENANMRVMRGGSWVGDGRDCRPSVRGFAEPGLDRWWDGYVGFRPALLAPAGDVDGKSAESE